MSYCSQSTMGAPIYTYNYTGLYWAILGYTWLYKAVAAICRAIHRDRTIIEGYYTEQHIAILGTHEAIEGYNRPTW